MPAITKDAWVFKLDKPFDKSMDEKLVNDEGEKRLTQKEMLKIPDIHNPRYSYGGGKILAELMGVNYGKKYFSWT